LWLRLLRAPAAYLPSAFIKLQQHLEAFFVARLDLRPLSLHLANEHSLYWRRSKVFQVANPNIGRHVTPR
jgi:hypothetical protein